MKKEALHHTKMKRLCRRLNLPLWQGVGLMETLWQLTGRQAPRGDIGKLSNEDIAMALDYRGDEDPMIEALVSCGWLETHPEFRLVVHDWADHCDDGAHAKLARAHLYFWDGSTPSLHKLWGEERKTAVQFYNGRDADHSGESYTDKIRRGQENGRDTTPTPHSGETGARMAAAGARQDATGARLGEMGTGEEKAAGARNAVYGRPNEPNGGLPSLAKPSQAPTTHTHSPGPAADLCVPEINQVRGFAEWYADYPLKTHKGDAEKVWANRVAAGDEPSVFACLHRYLDSDQVSRQVLMRPDTWLRTSADERWGCQWPPALRNGHSKRKRANIPPSNQEIRRMQAKEAMAKGDLTPDEEAWCRAQLAQEHE